MKENCDRKKLETDTEKKSEDSRVLSEVDKEMYLFDRHRQASEKYPPEEPQHKCQNIGWQYILDLENLECNGVKDSEFNDLIQFEDKFNSWQKQAILLTSIYYGKLDYYVTPLGAFTYIGTLARMLQKTLPRDAKISVLFTGDELTFSFPAYPENMQKALICNFVELDQANSLQHCDGWKLERIPASHQVLGVSIPDDVICVIRKLVVEGCLCQGEVGKQLSLRKIALALGLETEVEDAKPIVGS